MSIAKTPTATKRKKHTERMIGSAALTGGLVILASCVVALLFERAVPGAALLTSGIFIIGFGIFCLKRASN